MAEDFTPDFLGGEPLPPVAAEPKEMAGDVGADAGAAPAAEVPAAEPQAQPRAPDGKFAPAIKPDAEAPAEAAPAAAAPVQAEAPAAPVAAPTENDVAGKLAALLDERDKRQAAEQRAVAAEKRAQELEQWRQQQEAAARRQPIPERGTAEHEQWLQRQSEDRFYTQNLTLSRRLADVAYGPEVSSAAWEWGVQRCDADPYFNARVAAATRNGQSPMDIVVSEWRQAQALEKFGKVDPAKLEAFLAWEASQAPGAQHSGAAPATPNAPAAAPAAAPTPPRPSLASAPSAGTHADPRVGDFADVFEGAFTRK